jgi:hypothetical protein
MKPQREILNPRRHFVEPRRYLERMVQLEKMKQKLCDDRPDPSDLRFQFEQVEKAIENDEDEDAEIGELMRKDRVCEVRIRHEKARIALFKDPVRLVIATAATIQSTWRAHHSGIGPLDSRIARERFVSHTEWVFLFHAPGVYLVRLDCAIDDSSDSESEPQTLRGVDPFSMNSRQSTRAFRLS